MVSPKGIETLTYRQLQTTAKRINLPANFKKHYLVKLIAAKSEGDENLIKKIVEEASRERTNIKGLRSDKIITRRVLKKAKLSGCVIFAHRSTSTELEKLLRSPTISSQTLNSNVINLQSSKSVYRGCENYKNEYSTRTIRTQSITHRKIQSVKSTHSRFFKGYFGTEIMNSSTFQQISTVPPLTFQANSQQIQKQENNLLVINHHHVEMFASNMYESHAIMQDHSYLSFGNQFNRAPDLHGSNITPGSNVDYSKYSNPEYIVPEIGHKNMAFQKHPSSPVLDENRNIPLPNIMKAIKSGNDIKTDSSNEDEYPKNDKVVLKNMNQNQYHNYFLNKNIAAKEANKRQNRDDFLKEFMSLELICDVDDDISSSLQNYFENLDLALPSQMNKEISQDNLSTVCSVCGRIGKMAHYYNHVIKKHHNMILKSNDGVLTITVNMAVLKNGSPSARFFFIEDSGNLFIVQFDYKYPDIVCPELLYIPNNQHHNESFTTTKSKFYVQINNYTRGEEYIWSGNIEPLLRAPKRVFGGDNNVNNNINNTPSKLEICLRSLHLVPSNIALKDLTKFVDRCIVEMHFFIEKMPHFKK